MNHKSRRLDIAANLCYAVSVQTPQPLQLVYLHTESDILTDTWIPVSYQKLRMCANISNDVESPRIMKHYTLPHIACDRSDVVFIRHVLKGSRH